MRDPVVVELQVIVPSCRCLALYEHCYICHTIIRKTTVIYEVAFIGYASSKYLYDVEEFHNMQDLLHNHQGVRRSTSDRQ
jgi:hypothetical protein